MKKKLLLIGLAISMIMPSVFADEGMWLPLLLKNKQADMQKNGMRISAEDIYNVNSASLKDAVMLFGTGCTGEFVSEEGLLLTNHHCGYSFIVSHSTVERDYLTNGFWAMSREEELPCRGLTITRLVYMEDVTARVLNGVGEKMSEESAKERMKELEYLKVLPKDQEVNKKVIFRGERLYEESLGMVRMQIQELLLEFDAALESQDKKEIERVRKMLTKVFDEIENS
jgi:hypothetical protein